MVEHPDGCAQRSRPTFGPLHSGEASRVQGLEPGMFIERGSGTDMSGFGASGVLAGDGATAAGGGGGGRSALTERLS